MSAGRLQPSVVALAWAALFAAGAPAHADLLSAAESDGYHLSPTVYRQGAALLIDGPEGALSKEVDPSWHVRLSPAGERIALLRDSRTGTQLRLLDAAGSQLAERFFPIGEQVSVSDRGIVSLPHSGDQVLAPHRLRFYASNGELVGQVDEPDLAISGFQLLPGGRVLTRSVPSSAGHVTLVIYDERGDELFRHVAAASGSARILRASVSPDGQRLVYLQGAGEARSGTRLSIVDAAGQLLARHMLSHVNRLAISAASDRLAVVGTTSLALFDTVEGDLIWQVHERFDAPAVGALRFSEHGDELFVLASRIDAAGERARAYLYRARLADGLLTAHDLGEHSTHEGLTLLGASRDNADRLRLVLPRREILIDAPSGWGAAP